MAVKKTAAEMVTAAKAALVLDAPFFASLLLRLSVEEVDEKICPTMGTDGVSLVYSKKFVEGLTIELLKGVLCHEAMHIAMLHHLRRGARDLVRWNIAADAAINPVVKNARYQLPKFAVMKDEWANMAVEAIYPLIKVKEIAGCGGGGSGSGSCQGKGGDGQGGQDLDPTGCGAVYDQKNGDGSTMNDAQRKQAEQEAKMAVAHAAMAARQQGKLPAGLDRLVGNLLEPKIPWREVLARFITEHVKSNYSWKMPNKKYIRQDVYLPQLDECEIGTIVLFCDTSGSIQEDELNMFVSEITCILRAFPSIKLIKFDIDCSIHGEPEEIESGWTAKKFKGGGGTSFKPGFEYCVKHAITPICSIYLTDGECNEFSKEPDWPHLWVLVQEPHWGGGWKPPFGETIRMDERKNGKN